MIQKTVTQEFSPTRQGMIQSSGNLIINADTIDNHYSTIEAGGNADIHAGVLTNLGATGNIITQSDKETTITASHLLSGQDINVSGENVTIDGMTDH
uniref:hypothetical protein n=1 Tax=Bartonella sp. AP152HLJHH TaxID=3243469 RepID=UPI0035D028F7